MWLRKIISCFSKIPVLCALFVLCIQFHGSAETGNSRLGKSQNATERTDDSQPCKNKRIFFYLNLNLPATNETDEAGMNRFDLNFSPTNEMFEAGMNRFDLNFSPANETVEAGTNRFDLNFSPANETVEEGTNRFDLNFPPTSETVEPGRNIFDLNFPPTNETVEGMNRFDLNLHPTDVQQPVSNTGLNNFSNTAERGECSSSNHSRAKCISTNNAVGKKGYVVRARDELKLAHCNICNVYFRHEVGYEKHYSEDHKDANHLAFACIFCRSSYTEKCNLNRHILNKHPLEAKEYLSDDRTVFCPLCQIPFADITALEAHALRMHPMEKLIKCNFCEAAFHEEKILKRHVRGDHIMIHFKCMSCHSIFNRSDVKEVHVKYCRKNVAEKNLELQAYCFSCKMQFQSLSHYQMHREEIHFEFECQICLKTITSKKGLTKHIKGVHAEVASKYRKTYKCLQCNETFGGVINYENHGRECHPGQVLYVCNNCQRGFSRNCNLWRHQRVKHGNPVSRVFVRRAWKCRVCKICFHERHVLRNHQRHCGRNRVVANYCPVCDVVLHMKAEAFRKHRKRHSTYVECPVCRKNFHEKRSGAMEKHLTLVHGRTA